jgi:ribosome biogenesis GTPase A
MEIQWFPGHMLEAEQFLKQTVSRVDLILEVLDARLPESSANPLMDRLCRSVSRLKLLNKNDLADPEITGAWIGHFQSERGIRAVAVTGTRERELRQILDLELRDLEKNRARRTRILVVGIPNTGKSTIINTLAGRKLAKTGNTPAVTRQHQRATLKNHADIYDTPGILWPVIRSRSVALRLAASGAIADTAVDYQDLACFLAELLRDRYPLELDLRYGLGQPLDGSPSELVEKIGRARGCLSKGGAVNFQKASELLVREFRAGKIGRISLEKPGDIQEPSETEQT